MIWKKSETEFCFALLWKLFFTTKDNNANFFEAIIRGIISGLENHFYDKT